MKNNDTSSQIPQEGQHHIPNLDIIDLDKGTNADSTSQEEFEEAYDSPKTRRNNSKKNSGNFPVRINTHLILLIAAILLVAGIAYRFTHWGIQLDINEINNREDDEEYLSLLNAIDIYLPLMNADGEPIFIEYGEGTTILAFGNSPFADDRDSNDNLAKMIEEMTGATVYNCSVSGSYLAAGYPYLDTDMSPIDIFNFYWLCTLTVCDDVDNAYLSTVEKLGDNAPPEAMEVFNTLKSLDLNTIDVITIMYDGTDYLAGHEMYNDNNESDIQQFTGNMVAGIKLLQSYYPNIRFIVMSPAYAFGLDENGEYVSSDVMTYGQHFLSTYVIKQHDYCNNMSISFVDHLYGTITEANASDYLIDHYHLNVDGRKKVAERFVKMLKHYNELAAGE